MIPTQLGLHFWPDFARLNGIRYDYYSPTVYLIDIFIFLFLILNYKFLLKIYQKSSKKFLIVLVVIFLNLLTSLNRLNTTFQILRLFEYYSLYLVISKIPHLWKKISISFLSSLLLVAGVQLAQFISQKSLGGLFYFFGERLFSATTPNLPKVNINSSPLIRVSSLFPHPNALAGYFLLSFLILKKQLSTVVIKIVNIFSLFLTFSKSALLAFIAYFTKIKLGSQTYLVFVIFSLLQLFIPILHTNFYSLDSRSSMISNYLQLPPRYFLLGTGLGNYPTALKDLLPGSMSTLAYLQPIHNLLLLLIAETGIPVTSLIVYCLIKKFNKKYYPIILVVLITGLFDHYWLTIPQDKLILLLAFALFK